MRARLLELMRFSAVGGVAFLVDVGVFNLLRFGPGQVLEHKVLTAKVVSVTVATLVSWLGNRYWAFAAKRSDQRVRELVVFVVVNVVGMGIAVGCLAVSHYLLNLTSAFADNVSGNIVGIGLGTLFRYVAYRTVVFTAEPPRAEETSAASPATATTATQ